MTYASVTDVSKRLGRPITVSTEVDQVEAWLEDIESLILARIPNLATHITEGWPTTETVAMIEANAVIRKVKNPDGYTSETIDDYTYRFNDSARKGDLFLTAEEWALLLPSRSTGGAWTITPYGSRRGRGEWLHPDVWVPLP